MAKRFTDSEKWNKRFIRGLKPVYKLLWLFICDECNHAGIWEVDMESAQLKIGGKISEADAIKFFGSKIVVIDRGLKWFIPSFIEFQYVELSEKNRAHDKVIFLLRRYGLLDDKNNVNKPLWGVAKAPMDMEEEEAMEEEEVKEEEEEAKQLVFPFTSEEFIQTWDLWNEYRKAEHKLKFKSTHSEQAALYQLSKLSSGDELLAKDIIIQSMARSWQGLFPLKEDYNAKPQQQTISDAAAAGLVAIGSMYNGAGK